MGIIVERMNLENEYLIDMITNNGYVVNDEQDQYSPVDIDRLVNSNKFTDVEYRCDCGAFIGQNIIGQVCPRCNSEISLHALNFRYTGWIDIAPHKVITPVYHTMLKRVLTPNMTKYILGDYKSDLSVQYNENDKNFNENKKKRKTGRVTANDIASIKKKVPKSKYIYEGLGHDVFYQRFEEVMKVCGKQTEELNILLREKDSVFTSKIPMYSTAFRPVSKTSETMFYPEINKSFSQIISVQCKLKNMILPVEKIQALNFIQNTWIEATERLISKEIAQKQGIVRSEIIGGTFNFSCRGVIILDNSLAPDECDLPLSSMMIAYQYKITHILAVRNNFTLEQAYLYVRDYKIHPEVVDILHEILDREPQWIMILREPVNNKGSVCIFRIRHAKPNSTTISLPPEVLAGYNADFDGDQLNGNYLGGKSDGMVQSYWKFHNSWMGNNVTEKVSIPLKEWNEICLGLMSL